MALWQAWTRCRLDRRRRPDIAAWDFDAELRVRALSERLRAGAFVPGAPRLMRVFDPKPRCVAITPIADRVLHQSLIGELGAWYARSFLEQSYGCLPGRGPYRALWALLAAMRARRYRVALDVRAFFPSIDRARLMALWAHRCRDEQTVALLSASLDAAAPVYALLWVRGLLGLTGPVVPGRGILVGSYLSHFSAALYLDGLDHFVKRQLKVPGYLRYMDDLVLLDDDAARLSDARDAVAAWLLQERGLQLKALHPVRACSQPLAWLGHRVSRAGVTPGRSLLRWARAAVLEAAEPGRVLASYAGLLRLPGG